MKAMTKGTSGPQGNRQFPVNKEQPLLAFLLEHYPKLSRNAVKNLLGRKEVSVDGTVQTRFDLVLQQGQTVEVLSKEQAALPAPPFPILYEDEMFFVINKPEGLLAVGNEKENERTAERLVRDYLEARRPQEQAFLVHRLDRDTSGVLIFVKDSEFKEELQQQWDQVIKKRRYIAIVEGIPVKTEDEIRTLLAENRETRQMVVTNDPAVGKEAITRYRIMKTKDDNAMLSVEILTGRKNQIRAHMRTIGHPIVGDKKYGGHRSELGRMGLHAAEVWLFDPARQKELRFQAPLPKKMGVFMK